MSELTSADTSLLSWVHQSGVSAHTLSVRFHPGSLVVQCQSLDDAAMLWETRSRLQMPGRELCFRVNGVFYVGAMMV